MLKNSRYPTLIKRIYFWMPGSNRWVEWPHGLFALSLYQTSNVCFAFVYEARG